MDTLTEKLDLLNKLFHTKKKIKYIHTKVLHCIWHAVTVTKWLPNLAVISLSMLLCIFINK